MSSESFGNYSSYSGHNGHNHYSQHRPGSVRSIRSRPGSLRSVRSSRPTTPLSIIGRDLNSQYCMLDVALNGASKSLSKKLRTFISACQATGKAVGKDGSDGGLAEQILKLHRSVRKFQTLLQTRKVKFEAGFDSEEVARVLALLVLDIERWCKNFQEEALKNSSKRSASLGVTGRPNNRTWKQGEELAEKCHRMAGMLDMWRHLATNNDHNMLSWMRKAPVHVRARLDPETFGSSSVRLPSKTPSPYNLHSYENSKGKGKARQHQHGRHQNSKHEDIQPDILPAVAEGETPESTSAHNEG